MGVREERQLRVLAVLLTPPHSKVQHRRKEKRSEEKNSEEEKKGT